MLAKKADQDSSGEKPFPYLGENRIRRIASTAVWAGDRMLIEPVSVRRRVYKIAGDILEAKRRQLRLSYRDLGERSYHDYTYIFKICKAQRDAEPRVISKIASALNFDEEYLFCLADMLLIPDNADKLSDAELSDNINRQNTFQRLILSSWEALVLIAILASGLPEVAEHYLSFYAPNYSSTRRFSSLFEELSEPLKLSSFGTLHQLIVNNRHEYTDDARAKKHFAFYYGGTYGDARLRWSPNFGQVAKIGSCS
jgi:hypothetical protein